MRMYVNRGKESFARARQSQIYVDKTGLLECTNEMPGTEQCYICNSRPRRFGKSMTAGKRYADMAFLPRRYSAKPALVVELKYGQSAESAIEQIRDRQYPEALKDYQKNLLLVGVSYDKESKEHFCIIEELNKE